MLLSSLLLRRFVVAAEMNMHVYLLIHCDDNNADDNDNDDTDNIKFKQALYCPSASLFIYISLPLTKQNIHTIFEYIIVLKSHINTLRAMFIIKYFCLMKNSIGVLRKLCARM